MRLPIAYFLLTVTCATAGAGAAVPPIVARAVELLADPSFPGRVPLSHAQPNPNDGKNTDTASDPSDTSTSTQSDSDPHKPAPSDTSTPSGLANSTIATATKSKDVMPTVQSTDLPTTDPTGTTNGKQPTDTSDPAPSNPVTPTPTPPDATSTDAASPGTLGDVSTSTVTVTSTNTVTDPGTAAPTTDPTGVPPGGDPTDPTFNPTSTKIGDTSTTSDPGQIPASDPNQIPTSDPGQVPTTQPTGTQTSAATSQPSPVPTAPLPVHTQVYLSLHNSARSSFGTGRLSWSSDLAAAAQDYAEKCKLEHSNGALGAVGENLVAATGHFDATAAVNLFTQDQVSFNSPSDIVFSHFTQVVWKNTTELGCGVAQCPGMFPGHKAPGVYHVCLYYPVGNVVGLEKINLNL